MPHLLTFLPCSDVIMDAFSNRLSLIGVMESIQPLAVAEVPPEQAMAGEAFHYIIGPFAIITLWARQGDEPEDFEQRIIMRAPDGREVVLSEVTRVDLARPFHRVITGAPGFAFLQTGTYWLLLQRRRNAEDEWHSEHEHPLLVQEIPLAQAEDRPIRLEDAPSTAAAE
jgi:hypothetical protein